MAGGIRFLGTLSNLASELGLSGLATMSPASVSITGGTASLGSLAATAISGSTLSLTGAAALSGAVSVTSSGSLSMGGAAFSASNVMLTGGSINGTAIGQTTPSTGSFTSLSTTSGLTVGGPTTLTGTLTASGGLLTASASISGGSINSTPIGATLASSGSFTSLSASGATTLSGTVIVPTPTQGDNSTKAASTAFVTQALSGAINGLQIKATANVATTAALPSYAYSNGVLTASANGALTIDGVAVAVGYVVLVKNETNPAYNGLYVVSAIGGSSAPFVLTRHADMSSASQCSGAFVPVAAGGVTNANSLWLCNPGSSVTLGTTALPFTQLNGATDLIAGAGITISGNTISAQAAAITSGTINGASIGASTPSTGSFTTLAVASTATFSGSVSVTGGQFSANASLVGTTANTKYLALQANANDGNSDNLQLLFNQSGTASGWPTVNPRIQRKVDNTYMGYVEFGDGTGNAQVVRIGSEAGGLCASFVGTQTILFGTLSAPGMATFNGGVTVNNNSTFNNNLTVASTGTLYANGPMAVTGTAYLNGTTQMASNATVAGTLGVAGVLTATGGIYTVGQISVNGTSSAFVVADRATSGSSQYYRSSGVTALWDSTYGNALTYNSTGNVTIPGTLNVQSNGSVFSNLQITGSAAGGQGGGLFLSAANAGIELGSAGTSNTPYIDFHSSGNNNDNDFRIIASSGSSTGTNGNLSLNGAGVYFNCVANFNSAVNTTGAASGLNIYDRTASNTGMSALYRQNGVTDLYDSAFGNVLSFNSAGAVTLAGALSVTGATTLAGGAKVASANAQLQVQNTNDGGLMTYVGNTFGHGLLGMYNSSGSGQASNGSYTSTLASGASIGALAWTTSGAVGSINNTTYPSTPSFRNMLDDGSGNMTASGYVGSGRTGAQFLAPGYMHYSDSSNYYFLLTGSSTITTSFNGLRPFYINLSTGAVTMGNSLTVNGSIFVNNGANYGFATSNPLGLQMQNANTVAIRDITNGSSTMYFDVSAGGSTNGAYCWRSSSSYSALMSLTATGLSVPSTITGSSLAFSGYSYYGPGCIYTDTNWGVIIRAYQANPVAADFDFQNSAGTSRLRLTSGTSTLSTALSVTGATTLAGLTVNNSFAANVMLGVTGCVFVGNGAVGSQGAFLQWNRDNGGGGTWLVNQKGGGGGGISLGECTTGNVFTSSMYVAPAGGTSFYYSNLNMSGYAVTNSPSIAKAWVYFDYQGNIISSYNVSSVTVNNTGQYTINFPSGVFADANYAYSLSMQKDQNSSIVEVITRTNGGTKTATAFQVDANYASGGNNGGAGGAEFCAFFFR